MNEKPVPSPLPAPQPSPGPDAEEKPAPVLAYGPAAVAANGPAGPVHFENVAILSVGLLGGSLGMALHQRALAGRVTGVGRSARRLLRAIELGAIDEYDLDLEPACAQADLIVLCGPVSVILEQLPLVIRAARPGALITDVGSTKNSIVRRATINARDDVHFVGSHPIAGSERSGVESARPGLFQGATVVITPNISTPDAALDKIRALWRALGMRIIELLPARHDQLLGMLSHLPHLAAAAIVEHVRRRSEVNPQLLAEVAGAGFRDTTRLALGDPSLWVDIFLDNADEMIRSIDEMRSVLADFRTALLRQRDDTLAQMLQDAAEFRRPFERDAGK